MIGTWGGKWCEDRDRLTTSPPASNTIRVAGASRMAMPRTADALLCESAWPPLPVRVHTRYSANDVTAGVPKAGRLNSHLSVHIVALVRSS